MRFTMTRVFILKDFWKKKILNTLKKCTSVFHRNIESHQGTSKRKLLVVFRQTQTLSYNKRHQADVPSRPMKSVYYGRESLGYFGPKIWHLLPAHLKNSKSLEVFKSGIKKYKLNERPCRFCKIYIHHVGLISDTNFILLFYH